MEPEAEPGTPAVAMRPSPLGESSPDKRVHPGPQCGVNALPTVPLSDKTPGIFPPESSLPEEDCPKECGFGACRREDRKVKNHPLPDLSLIHI